MDNFQLFNPVNIVFGKNTIGELPNLLKDKSNILFAYGGGSIKKNGVYQQIKTALSHKTVFEFAGIEANPDYDTLMKAVEICRKDNIDFILAVGGGSVIDGCKFIAHAAKYKGKNPWEILLGKPMKDAIPLGCILTLSATGSEMNTFSVISKRSTNEKKAFSSPLSFPKFSILDPSITFSLPERQVINGIIDPFVHVAEQYLTYDVNAPLQNRQSEAILKTLIEEGPKALKNPTNYDVRANLMWCATNALNGTIGKGVPQDWATHEIGHELTACFGLDHAQTLAVILPAVLKYEFAQKKKRLSHFGQVIFNIKANSDNKIAKSAIEKTENFFRSLGAKTRISEYKISKKALKPIPTQVIKTAGGKKLGEHMHIGEKEISEILDLAFEKY
ncbi:iron-containing alcohol dehydrogenase [Fluviispira multicolorata]|uniref:Iron-containing alcohol dehydrogenase n=1 Tax=Fluviispira multicolorata TaxID=2654512 RepID=A0A833N5R2_9BACT|nr:iron-containing alcohol dehydrogenase [Fluviispira multicolorata]KAB8031027.1 iron-containing alcohol dehydrogenase [Fluviispira multicolorata]